MVHTSIPLRIQRLTIVYFIVIGPGHTVYEVLAKIVTLPPHQIQVLHALFLNFFNRGRPLIVAAL